MPKKRFSAEQIVTLLRQIEVLMAQGKSAPVACRGYCLLNAPKRTSLLNLHGEMAIIAPIAKAHGTELEHFHNQIFLESGSTTRTYLNVCFSKADQDGLS
jgi:hypothetical protein